MPKFLVNADGSLGARNDVRCVSLEHKLGIHASPTAVLAFGDKEGAVGHIVGEENRGLEYMFVMMNLARFGVGMQGVGIAERAYQRARDYARDRVQGRVAGAASDATSGIIGHPDVRRMLMTMRAQPRRRGRSRYVTAAALDRAHRHPDAGVRKRELAFAELMIPIVKGWSTEIAQQIAYLGVQVHGGMGFIEETGAAQYARDARITTIYEGTTGIQANDLIGRKIARDGGKTLFAALETSAACTRMPPRARTSSPSSASACAPAWTRSRMQRAGSSRAKATIPVPSSPGQDRFSSSPAPSAAVSGSGGRRSRRHDSLQPEMAMPISCARRSRPRDISPNTA